METRSATRMRRQSIHAEYWWTAVDGRGRVTDGPIRVRHRFVARRACQARCLASGNRRYPARSPSIDFCMSRYPGTFPDAVGSWFVPGTWTRLVPAAGDETRFTHRHARAHGHGAAPAPSPARGDR